MGHGRHGHARLPRARAVTPQAVISRQLPRGVSTSIICSVRDEMRAPQISLDRADGGGLRPQPLGVDVAHPEHALQMRLGVDQPRASARPSAFIASMMARVRSACVGVSFSCSASSRTCIGPDAR